VIYMDRKESCVPGLFIEKWKMAAPVRSARFVDRYGYQFILSRNMDDQRHKYAWRISRFDKDGFPCGHRYGTTAEDAMNYGIWRGAELVEVM